MRRVTLKLAVRIVLIGCFFLSGCASPRILLTKNQKEILLKPEEGGVIFSFRTAGVPFKPYSISIQNINQYKEYKKKRFELVYIPGYGGQAYEGLYLCNVKLPKGTYRLAYFYGIAGGFWGKQFYMPCNKIFDVNSGEISYLGRVDTNLHYENHSYFNDISVIDSYEEDRNLFTQYFPILNGRDIKTDLLY